MRAALSLCAAAAAAHTAAAAPLTAGTLVVMQLGNGAAAVSSAHQPVTLVEIS